MDDTLMLNQYSSHYDFLTFKKLDEKEYKSELKKIFTQSEFKPSTHSKELHKIVCSKCNKEHTQESLIDSEVSIIGCGSAYPYLIITCACQQKIEVRPKY